MTRILSEGFEMQDLVGYSTSTGSINTTTKRSGGASIALDDGEYFHYVVSDLTEVYVRFAIYWAGNGTTRAFYLICRHGTTELTRLYINLLSGNLVAVQVGSTTQDTGVIPISTGAWYVIEFRVKIDDATGVLDTKVDGVSDATFSGDTKPGADAHIDNLLFYNGSGGGLGENMVIYLDDIGINNTAGGVDDSWLGDGRIIVIKPNGDTATLQLTPSAVVDHNTLVDDIPADGDTTYVEGSTVDERDIYDLAACGLTDVIITRIWTEARAKDTASSGKTIALITKASGGAEVSGGDIALAGTYTTKVLGAEELENPVDTNPWEVADIDALQGGPKTRS